MFNINDLELVSLKNGTTENHLRLKATYKYHNTLIELSTQFELEYMIIKIINAESVVASIKGDFITYAIDGFITGDNIDNFVKELYDVKDVAEYVSKNKIKLIKGEIA